MLLSAEDNYTVIFGSHRNTSQKIEKNGLPCSTVRLLFRVSEQRAVYACCVALHMLRCVKGLQCLLSADASG